MLGCKHPGISSSQSGAGFVLQDFALEFVFLQPLKYINRVQILFVFTAVFTLPTSHFLQHLILR